MPPAEPAPEHRCPNCDAPAADAYCSRCGQGQHDRLRTSLPALVREAFAELLDLDAKVAVTLRTLVRRPGLLTTEYLAGRRARYVRPLRLYLTLSVLYFVVVSLTGGGSFLRQETRVTDDDASADATASAAAMRRSTRDSAAADSAAAAARRATARADTGSFLQRRSARLGALAPEERDRLMRDTVVRHLPKAFFALVPALALILRVLYRHSGFHYAEHLIFSLHYQALAFVAFTVSELAELARPPAALESVVEGAIFLLLLCYLFVALRRVYRQSRVRTAVKLALLLPAYAVAFVVAMVVLFGAALATV